MRWLKRVTVAMGCIVVVVVLSGAGVEAAVRVRTGRQFPPAGRLVDIGGRRLQLDCRGSGSPTVVLESGLDYFGSLSWAAVHDSLARTTRVCAYSRAGILWSDPAPGPFDAQRAARDLHAALTKAGETAPWVMVGHSIGGPYALLFTNLYQADVRGVVLVDASHPAQFARRQASIGRPLKPPTGLLAVASALAWTGIVRLASDEGAPATWPGATVGIGNAYLPRSVSALLAETRALDATLAEADRARRLDARPLVVLTAAARPSSETLVREGLTPEEGERSRAIWMALQDDEATWSSQSAHELVTDATHYIQFDRPDVVIRAVRDVVARVRSSEPRVGR